MRIVFLAVAALIACCFAPNLAIAQTTRPAEASIGAATRPAGKSADEMLDQLLKPTPGAGKPIESAPAINTGGTPATSGASAVAPGAPLVTVMREGSDIVNRLGRLTRSADGQQWEFTFESDGRTMLDPPVFILPSLKLMEMEKRIGGSNRDPRFRITGEVTEYHGRNYILLRKVAVVSDAERQF